MARRSSVSFVLTTTGKHVSTAAFARGGVVRSRKMTPASASRLNKALTGFNKKKSVSHQSNTRFGKVVRTNWDILGPKGKR